MYTVYAHRNLKNGKSYVGMTSRKPNERWNNGWGYQNNSKMWKDIQNSDWNKDWEHNIIGQFENKDEALKYAAFLIAMLGTVRTGYNTSAYASHYCKHLEESKRKMSDNHADFSGENNPNFGKHFSEESKKKISESKGVNGILQFSKDGKFIAEYPSIREASKQTGCYHGDICKCCKGRLKTCGGFIWKYT